MPKGELIIRGNFEWFSEKNLLNVKKHGFSFEQILDVFDDPYFYEIYDEGHSDADQDRFFGLGCASGVFVVAVSYTENDRIHLISARLASPREKTLYDAYCGKIDS